MRQLLLLCAGDPEEKCRAGSCDEVTGCCEWQRELTYVSPLAALVCPWTGHAGGNRIGSAVGQEDA
jgi:hypothetical protein